MGTFEGHLLPGAAFAILGLWHLLNVILSYVSAPSSFHTRLWFPAKLPGKWKYIELHLIATVASLSILMEMVLGKPGHWMLDKEGHIPINMMAQFEHASMSLFFLLYALIALSTEGCYFPRCRPLPFGMLHVLGGCALAQEYLLFYYHSGDHMGVEGQYHALLRIPIAVALLSGLLEIPFPRFFLLPLLRSSGMLLQGLVLMQTAFSIFVPSLLPLHCTSTPQHAVVCEGEDWTHRAKALANLQFNWWCAALIVFVVVLFTLLRSKYGKEEYLPLNNSNMGCIAEPIKICSPESRVNEDEEVEDGCQSDSFLVNDSLSSSDKSTSDGECGSPGTSGMHRLKEDA